MFLVPNNSALSATIVPLRTPAGVDLLARLREGVLPSELEQLLTREVSVPTRDDPDISLEEVYADSVIVRIGQRRCPTPTARALPTRCSRSCAA